MSFSKDLKSEICKRKIVSKKDSIAELSGIVRMNGSILISSNSFKINFKTENNSIARRIFSLVKYAFSYDSEIFVLKNNQLKKNAIYNIEISDPKVAQCFIKKTMLDNDVFSGFLNNIPNKILLDDKLKFSFLRGNFLGAGSITNPKKSYHLEMVCENKKYAFLLSEFLNDYKLKSAVVSRKGKYILYIKDSENISDFLIMIGANNALLEMENIKAMKDLKNQLTRIVNCETANINKIVNTGVRQSKAIKKIKEKIGIESLPENLKEIAKLRLQYTDISLTELGKKMNPVIGKSGVYYRMKKIIDIADEL